MPCVFSNTSTQLPMQLRNKLIYRVVLWMKVHWSMSVHRLVDEIECAALWSNECERIVWKWDIDWKCGCGNVMFCIITCNVWYGCDFSIVEWKLTMVNHMDNYPLVLLEDLESKIHFQKESWKNEEVGEDKRDQKNGPKFPKREKSYKWTEPPGLQSPKKVQSTEEHI